MKQKLFLQVLSVLFAAKVAFGVLYLFFGWDVIIADWIMPPWLVVVAIVVDSYFSFLACKLSKEKK